MTIGKNDGPGLRTAVIFILQVMLGGIFIYAGVSKLMDTLRFTASLLGYQIIPVSAVKLLVYTVPLVEIGLGLLLILGKYPKPVAGALSVLLFFFTLLLIYALSQGWIIDCGCFGSPRPVDGKKIFENIILFLIAFRFYSRPESVRPISEWRVIFLGRNDASR